MLFWPSFKVLSGYFYVSLNLTGILYFPNLADFHDTGPLSTIDFPSVGFRDFVSFPFLIVCIMGKRT